MRPRLATGSFLVLLAAAGLVRPAAGKGPAAGSGAARDGRPRPDIVVLLADDLGSGDLSCYGAEAVRTPNLDGIAARGIRYDAAYAPSSVCTPTRYGLLTGRYPWRDGVWTYLRPGEAWYALSPGRETLATYLRDLGYATGMFGKWHLGFGSPESPDALTPGPLDAGFDRFFGWTHREEGGNAGWVRDREWVGWKDGEIVEITPDAPPEVTDVLPRTASAALLSQIDAFLREEAGRPVFLWIATRQVHKPWTTAPEFRPRPGEGQYVASVEELDWLVGEILGRLEANGRRGNTLVVFASDNGAGGDPVRSTGGRHHPNGELRGRKGSVLEGGIRVPLLVEWPEKVPEGGVRSDPVSLVDVPATIAAALGVPGPAPFAADGTDLLAPAGGPRAVPIVAASGGSRSYALRSGDWKLIRSDRQPVQLFDLAEDPREERDRAAEHPEKVADLLELLPAAGVPSGPSTEPEGPELPDD